MTGHVGLVGSPRARWRRYRANPCVMERADGLRIHIGGWLLMFPGGRKVGVGGLSWSDDGEVQAAIDESRRAMRVEPSSQRRAVIAWAERLVPRVCSRCHNGVLRPKGLLGWRCDRCCDEVLFAPVMP